MSSLQTFPLASMFPTTDFSVHVRARVGCSELRVHRQAVQLQLTNLSNGGAVNYPPNPLPARRTIEVQLFRV